MALLRWPACLKRAALLTGLVGPQATGGEYTRKKKPGGFGRQDESTSLRTLDRRHEAPPT